MTLPKILKPPPIFCSVLFILCCTVPLRAQGESAREAATRPEKSSADTGNKPPATNKSADVGQPAETGKPHDASKQPEQPKAATPADGQPNLTASCSPNEGCRLGSALSLHFNQPPDKSTAQTLELMLDGRVMKGLTPRGPLVLDKDGKGAVPNLRSQTPSLEQGYVECIAGRRSKPQPECETVAERNAGRERECFRSFQRAPVVVVGDCPDDDSPSSLGSSRWPSKATSCATGLIFRMERNFSFSLGRTQMAWWTFIIACSFLYIWMVTWDWTFLPGSALVLMGISAATAMGAQLVDGNRNRRRQALLDQQKSPQ